MLICFVKRVSLLAKFQPQKKSCRSMMSQKSFFNIERMEYWSGFYLNFFEYLFWILNVHHSFPNLDIIFMLMVKWTKGDEIGKFSHISIHLVQTCFWPFKLQIVIMCILTKTNKFYVAQNTNKFYGGYNVDNIFFHFFSMWFSKDCEN